MKKFLVAAFAAFALLTSCNLDVDYVYPAAEYLVAEEAGGSYDTSVLASGSWSAQISAPEDLKMSISPASGIGETPITITVEPYEGEAEIVLGYVIFTCGDSKTSFPVYQITDEYKAKQEAGNN